MLIRSILASAALACCASLASAQTDWPHRPIRVIVPLAPGGPSDIVLRSAAEKMHSILKQPVIIDNKPGSGGNIGASEAARAKPDGYTWLWTTDTLVTVNPHVYSKLNFKLEDLQPVMRASELSQTLVCNPNSGVRSVADLVHKAKQRSFTYATGGAGSPGHLTTELFKSVARIDMVHVPYKGPAPAAQDLMSGQVDCGFLAGPSVLPHVRAGRMVALAVSGTKRSPLLPEVPTMAESGFPGFESTFSLVLFAPRGVPRPVIDAMRAAMETALRQPDVIERLRQTDQDVVASSAEAAVARLAEDSKKWGAVARKINLHID